MRERVQSARVMGFLFGRWAFAVVRQKGVGDVVVSEVRRVKGLLFGCVCFGGVLPLELGGCFHWNEVMVGRLA